MPAQKPQRPDTGILPALPRVTDEATQRALDQLALSLRQVLGTVSATNATVSGQESGRLIGRQTFLVSGPYTRTPGTTRIRVRMGGAGGGGGGATAAAATASTAAGGGSGACIEFELTGEDVADGTVTIGAAAAGGSSGGGNGATGGDTTLAMAGVTYIAKGGTGGQGASNSGGLFVAAGGSPQAGSTSIGTVTGFYGDDGVTFDTAAGGAGYQGRGAPSLFGVGGQRAAGNTTPAAPVGRSSGGAGAIAVSGSAAGGPSAPGIVIIEEHA